MATKKSSRKTMPPIIVAGQSGRERHHITDPFLPPTPEAATYQRSPSPQQRPQPPFYLRWAIEPVEALKVLIFPLVLWGNWELVSPHVNPGIANPFGHTFLLSGLVQDSKPDDPRYQKTWWDLSFLCYYVVFFSLVRQSLLFYVSRPLARWFGLKRSKVDRFGEQIYAFVYFLSMGLWGLRIMRTLPTNWYNTKAFWTDYPHWDMKPELKRYYLMQFSYWLQQLLVLVLKLEKPRKDYAELVTHHLVTLWLVGWSYFINLTLIGNAVYMSMDLPDAFLAVSKLLNYIQWNTAKIYVFILFFGIWTYFRHYLSLKILWSVWFEEPQVIPATSKRWNWAEGTYLPDWMKYQVFIPLVLLQCLNLFWYWLMVKIVYRALTSFDADDIRSDNEDNDDAEGTTTKKV